MLYRMVPSVYGMPKGKNHNLEVSFVGVFATANQCVKGLNSAASIINARFGTLATGAVGFAAFSDPLHLFQPAEDREIIS
jgi:hypothetical protein